MNRCLGRAALIFCLSALAAVPAFAHAELLDASPAAGSTTTSTVRFLRLTFSEELRPSSHADLYQGAFERALPVSCGVKGDRIECVPDRPVGAGDYTVQWTAVSVDDHSTMGAYSFQVAPASPLLPLALLLVAGATVTFATLRRRAHSQ